MGSSGRWRRWWRRWKRLPKPYHVQVFPNGLCAVFDRDFHQIPELQGYWAEMRPEIMRRKPFYIEHLEQKGSNDGQTHLSRGATPAMREGIDDDAIW